MAGEAEEVPNEIAANEHEVVDEQGNVHVVPGNEVREEEVRAALLDDPRSRELQERQRARMQALIDRLEADAHYADSDDEEESESESESEDDEEDPGARYAYESSESGSWIQDEDGNWIHVVEEGGNGSVDDEAGNGDDAGAEDEYVGSGDEDDGEDGKGIDDDDMEHAGAGDKRQHINPQ